MEKTTLHYTDEFNFPSKARFVFGDKEAPSPAAESADSKNPDADNYKNLLSEDVGAKTKAKEYFRQQLEDFKKKPENKSLKNPIGTYKFKVALKIKDVKGSANFKFYDRLPQAQKNSLDETMVKIHEALELKPDESKAMEEGEKAVLRASGKLAQVPQTPDTPAAQPPPASDAAPQAAAAPPPSEGSAPAAAPSTLPPQQPAAAGPQPEALQPAERPATAPAAPAEASRPAVDAGLARQKKEILDEVAGAVIKDQKIMGEILKNQDFTKAVATELMKDETVRGIVTKAIEANVSTLDQLKTVLAIRTEISTTDLLKTFWEAIKDGKAEAINFLFTKTNVLSNPKALDVFMKVARDKGILTEVVSKLPDSVKEKMIQMALKDSGVMATLLQHMPDIIKSNPSLVQKVFDMIPMEKKMELATELLKSHPELMSILINKAFADPTIMRALFANEGFKNTVIEIAMKNPAIKAKIEKRVLEDKLGREGGGLASSLGDLFRSVPGIGDMAAVLEDQLARDPDMQAMVLESVRNDPTLQQQIFADLKPKDREQIMGFVMSDPSMEGVRTALMGKMVTDPDIMKIVMNNLPPGTIEEIAMSLFAQ